MKKEGGGRAMGRGEAWVGTRDEAEGRNTGRSR
jgi:hypothetical protein